MLYSDVGWAKYAVVLYGGVVGFVWSSGFGCARYGCVLHAGAVLRYYTVVLLRGAVLRYCIAAPYCSAVLQ